MSVQHPTDKVIEMTNEELMQMVKSEAQKIEDASRNFKVYDDEDEDSEDYNPDYCNSDDEWVNEETLDCEFTIDSNGRYLGVKFILCLGGPGIVADSRQGVVSGVWGTDRFEWGLSQEAQDWLRGRGAELFDLLD